MTSAKPGSIGLITKDGKMKKNNEQLSEDYQDFLLERLRDPVAAAEYINACLEETDMPEVFLSAMRNVAKAHGVSNLAHETKLNRENLYRMFSPRGNPSVLSLIAILKALGLRLSVNFKTARRPTASHRMAG
jgi:probable addiction module antidote protein